MTDKLLRDGSLLLFRIEMRQRGRTGEELLEDGKFILAKIEKRRQQRSRSVSQIRPRLPK